MDRRAIAEVEGEIDYRLRKNEQQQEDCLRELHEVEKLRHIVKDRMHELHSERIALLTAKEMVHYRLGPYEDHDDDDIVPETPPESNVYYIITDTDAMNVIEKISTEVLPYNWEGTICYRNREERYTDSTAFLKRLAAIRDEIIVGGDDE